MFLLFSFRKVSDVQYIVLRNSRNIVVSWVETRDDTKKNVVHCYCFAPDYQTVISIREIDTIDHHVSSLHNIEGKSFWYHISKTNIKIPYPVTDCNNMIMGYGEEHITLWNLEYGYVVATIEIKGPVSTNYQKCIWTKCDRVMNFLKKISIFTNYIFFRDFYFYSNIINPKGY